MSKVNWKTMEDWELAKHMVTISESAIRQQKFYWKKLNDLAMLDKIDRATVLRKKIIVLLQAREYGAILPTEFGLDEISLLRLMKIV